MARGRETPCAHIQAGAALQLASQQLQQCRLARRGRPQQQREAARRQQAADVVQNHQLLLL